MFFANWWPEAPVNYKTLHFFKARWWKWVWGRFSLASSFYSSPFMLVCCVLSSAPIFSTTFYHLVLCSLLSLYLLPFLNKGRVIYFVCTLYVILTDLPAEWNHWPDHNIQMHAHLLPVILSPSVLRPLWSVSPLIALPSISTVWNPINQHSVMRQIKNSSLSLSYRFESSCLQNCLKQ